MISLVIFDCDGTLVDSLEGITRCMMLAFRDEGLQRPVSEAEVRNVVGLSLGLAVETMLPGVEEVVQNRVVERYKKHYKELADARQLSNPLFPGVKETLDRLRDRGVRLAMATGKSRRGVGRTLEETGLGPWFATVRTADCAPSKPHPGMIEQILQELDCPPDEALMVGDTDFDILMGHAAGVRTCAVTYGCHDRQRLAAAKPHHWIEAMPELLALPLW
ncbi:MAG: HAD-IA family hydrolase [Magnetococcales bacterium]|nr:HAD-IA family hydrolase [Magnetococcales bacterium]